MSSSFLRAFVPCACALVLAGAAQAQSYSFVRFAGTPPPRGFADASGTQARFNLPTAVAVDAAGSLYVADTFNHAIRKVSASGVVTTLAGTPGVSGSNDDTGMGARFSSPFALALDAAGNVWVTDHENHTVRKITPAGAVTTFAGTAGSAGAADGTGSAARFNFPVGIVVDAEGNVYVADRNNRLIRKITPGGVVSTLAGAAGPSGDTDGTGTAARFGSLSNLAIDGGGNLYATDNERHVIRKITSAGVVTTIAGLAGTSGTSDGTGTAARFGGPNGIAFDRDGNLYVADTSNDSIRRVAPDGTVTRIAGTPAEPGNFDGTGATSRFFRPYGIATDSAGNVYVADTNNHSIRKIAAGGGVVLLAGGGGNFGAVDGAGAAARFYLPQGIAVDAAGTVYVSDTYNAAVRKITPSGSVSTFVGQLGTRGYVNATGANARFGAPFGITLDSGGNALVADAGYNTIRHISPAGVVLTYVGEPNPVGGFNDGAPNSARFLSPLGVVTGPPGVVYVADTANHIIRRVNTTNGDVSTFAGGVGIRGFTDGTGTVARFSSPSGLAVDSGGNLFVADSGNHTIRRITPAGAVSTIAGFPGTSGSADGPAATARFNAPLGIAIDPAGNIFVADTSSFAIRRLTPAGLVTTIGGMPGSAQFAEGTGSNARFFAPAAIAIDAAGALFIADSTNNVIFKGALDTRPAVVFAPQSGVVQPGATYTFSVTASGGGLRYQWKLNGEVIPNATSATYTVTHAQAPAAGSYTVDITNSAGTTTSAPATLAIATTTDVGCIANLSILTSIPAAGGNFTLGYVVGGAGTSGALPLVIRAAGPSLGALGVAGTLADPKFELFAGSTKSGENDNWGGSATLTAALASVGAFAYSGPTSLDAAALANITTRENSVLVSAANTGTGVVLAEIYDAMPFGTRTAATPRLLNVSVNKQLDAGATLIAGFVIGGQTSKTVLIRAIGPTLATFGVPGALLDPKLALYSSAGKINENDDWGGSAALSSAFTSVGAFPLNGASRDAVLLVTLPPGNYTAQATGVGNASGVALVEVYDVP